MAGKKINEVTAADMLEAKERIIAEWRECFLTWLDDEANLDDKAYGKKYGYTKATTAHGYDLNSFLSFIKYFKAGKYIINWESAGYDTTVIRLLYRDEHWLSYQYNPYQPYRDREDFYYIPQRTARQIWKQIKSR